MKQTVIFRVNLQKIMKDLPKSQRFASSVSFNAIEMV